MHGIAGLAAAGTVLVLVLLTVILLTLGGTYLLLAQGERILKLFGRTGLNVMTRIMGLLVAVIAVQFVLDGGDKLHVFWQGVPYFILTLAEVLVSTTMLELAYSQAPREMKSTVMALYNLMVTLGNLLAAGILEMRGVAGKPGWFWLFLIEGLLTGVIGFTSYLYLPASPTDTKNVLWPKGYYTEREEVIMVNRILRDDPAKGLTAIKEAASFRDIWEAWKDPAMWGLYFIGLIAVLLYEAPKHTGYGGAAVPVAAPAEG